MRLCGHSVRLRALIHRRWVHVGLSPCSHCTHPFFRSDAISFRRLTFACHNCTETLRLIDAFVPRITFGKVVQRPAAPVAQAIASDREEQGHTDRIANASDTRLSESENERGKVSSTCPEPKAAREGRREQEEGHQDNQVRAAAQAFAYVKRELVRLLGILASQDGAVQDRVRGCGGIPVVMNLCVVDDHNPCKCLHWCRF